MSDTPDQRLLLVHAHPDDETINNGATMARYVEEGRGVTLVTCTAGEMGEVLVPDLAYLAADQQDGLGPHRRGELDAAMRVLGVSDYRFLGGFGTYRDSGMKWHEDGHAIAADPPEDGRAHENAFWHADLTAAADHLVEVIREVRPQVLVTYDQFGGYGHPDHIQAHRVAMYAATLAGVPSYRKDLGQPWEIAKIYWTAMSESRMRASLRRLRESGDTETFAGMEPDGDLPPFITPDELISARVDGCRLRGAEAGSAGRAPHPGRGGRAVLQWRRERACVLGRGVLPHRPRHPRPRPGRLRGRPVRRAVTVRRIAGALALFLAGGVTALASVAAHELWWGLPLAAAAIAGTFVWIGRGWLTRLPFALGYVGVVLVAIDTRPEGDFVVASSTRGYLLLLLTLLVLVVAVVTLPPPGRAPVSGPAGGTT